MKKRIDPFLDNLKPHSLKTEEELEHLDVSAVPGSDGVKQEPVEYDDSSDSGVSSWITLERVDEQETGQTSEEEEEDDDGGMANVWLN